MIANLRETTERNAEQDWLNSNLARFSGMMQGQRDLQTVSRLIMSELTPLVGASTARSSSTRGRRRTTSRELQLIASYGYKTAQEGRRTASSSARGSSARRRSSGSRS